MNMRLEQVVSPYSGGSGPVNCDVDGDGYDLIGGSCGGDDCDDGDANVNPSVTDVCGDGIDNDCSGTEYLCVDYLKDTHQGNLVSWWRFDEISDEMGVNNAVNGGATPVSGQFGGAYLFDASTENITYPYQESLNFGANQDFSVLAWVNLSSSAGATHQQYIIEAYQPTPSQGYIFFNLNSPYVNYGLVGVMVGETGSNPSIVPSPNLVVPGNSWDLTGFVADRDQNISFYGNDVFRFAAPINGFGNIAPNKDLVTHAKWGKMVLDELMIFNKSLTEAEINTIKALNLNA